MAFAKSTRYYLFPVMCDVSYILYQDDVQRTQHTVLERNILTFVPCLVCDLPSAL